MNKGCLKRLLMMIMVVPMIFACSQIYVHADSIKYTGEKTLEYTDDYGTTWNCSILSYGECIQINGCDSVPESGVMTIPGEIDDYPVSTIKFAAFKDNDNVKANLRELVLADNITSIGNLAFCGCSALEKIVFPANLQTIHEQAFQGCTAISELNFNDGLLSIGGNAFHNCDSIKSVDIPASVIKVGCNAFSDCDSLSAITVEDRNEAYCASDGVLYNSDKSTLVIYPKGREGDRFDIPAAVTAIGEMAFAYSNLTSMDIPSSVKRIDSGAFYYASRLKTVSFSGSGLEYIGQDAFQCCSALESVDVPSGVTEIGEGAFSYCKSLKTISLPSGIETLGNSVFNGSTSLQSVSIPADAALTAIPSRAFDRCTGIRYFRVPDNVVSIGEYAFYGCLRLKGIYIPEKNGTIGCSDDDSNVFCDCGWWWSKDTSVIIYGSKDSYALKTYAPAAGIAYQSATAGEFAEIVSADGSGGNQGGDSGNDQGDDSGGESGDDQGGGSGDDQGDDSGGDDPADDTPVQSAQTIIVSSSSFSKTTNSSAFSLGARAETALSYASSNSSVAAVDTSGKVTIKGPGSAVITINAEASDEYCAASKQVKVNVRLAAPGLTAKNKRGRKVKITWTRSQTADGYKLYIKSPGDKKFKCRLTKSAKVKSVTHLELKKGKKYKYKVVAFKKVNGKEVYSSFSKTVTVKVKK